MKKKLKVAQCWDDGVYTDILLTDILKEYDAKATFNLCSGLIYDRSEKPFWFPRTGQLKLPMKTFHPGRVGRKKLKKVYSKFEVASHCDKHENATKIDPHAFVESAVKCRKFLEDIFEKECPGFAWPYGSYTEETVKLMQEAGFAYGRTTQTTEDVTAYENPMKLATSCHFMDSKFWQLYDKAKETTGVFYFWGHSYEMMDYFRYWENFEYIIQCISDDPEAEWVNVIDLVRS